MGVRAALNSRVMRWMMAVAWMGVIFTLSAQSGLPSAPDELLDLIMKKGAHALEYALLAVLLLRALHPTEAPSPRKLLLPLLVAALYAASDELHQSFTANRHPSLSDVGIDAFGACLGLVVYAARPGSKS